MILQNYQFRSLQSKVQRWNEKGGMRHARIGLVAFSFPEPKMMNVSFLTGIRKGTCHLPHELLIWLGPSFQGRNALLRYFIFHP